jgi:hypothetical protein
VICSNTSQCWKCKPHQFLLIGTEIIGYL